MYSTALRQPEKDLPRRPTAAYRDNIFVKRSMPTVCFAHKGNNTQCINKVIEGCLKRRHVYVAVRPSGRSAEIKPYFYKYNKNIISLLILL